MTSKIEWCTHTIKEDNVSKKTKAEMEVEIAEMEVEIAELKQELDEVMGRFNLYHKNTESALKILREDLDLPMSSALEVVEGVLDKQKRKDGEWRKIVEEWRKDLRECQYRLATALATNRVIDERLQREINRVREGDEYLTKLEKSSLLADATREHIYTRLGMYGFTGGFHACPGCGEVLVVPEEGCYARLCDHCIEEYRGIMSRPNLL